MQQIKSVGEDKTEFKKDDHIFKDGGSKIDKSVRVDVKNCGAKTEADEDGKEIKAVDREKDLKKELKNEKKAVRKKVVEAFEKLEGYEKFECLTDCVISLKRKLKTRDEKATSVSSPGIILNP